MRRQEQREEGQEEVPFESLLVGCWLSSSKFRSRVFYSRFVYLSGFPVHLDPHAVLIPLNPLLRWLLQFFFLYCALNSGTRTTSITRVDKPKLNPKKSLFPFSRLSELSESEKNSMDLITGISTGFLSPPQTFSSSPLTGSL